MRSVNVRVKRSVRRPAPRRLRMILIDTDHATFLKYPESERGRRFIARLATVPHSEVVGVAIVTVEERMRGWLAVIAKEKTAIRQVIGYRELIKLFEFYQEFEIT